MFLLLSKYFLSFFSTVPTLGITLSPSGPIQEAMVGSPQMIQCAVSAVSGVESSSVMINWMGPRGDTITSDCRMTITPTTSSDNTYISSIQFIYLKQGDEGTYTCNIIKDGANRSESFEIETLAGKILFGRSKVQLKLIRE